MDAGWDELEVANLAAGVDLAAGSSATLFYEGVGGISAWTEAGEVELDHDPAFWAADLDDEGEPMVVSGNNSYELRLFEGGGSTLLASDFDRTNRLVELYAGGEQPLVADGCESGVCVYAEGAFYTLIDAFPYSLDLGAGRGEVLVFTTRDGVQLAEREATGWSLHEVGRGVAGSVEAQDDRVLVGLLQDEELVLLEGSR
jgi:hypothetical protein